MICKASHSITNFHVEANMSIFFPDVTFGKDHAHVVLHLSVAQ